VGTLGRRDFLKKTAMAAALPAARAMVSPLAVRAAEARPGSSRPNVLFILTDDHRRGAIHALGCEELITPNFDSLVRRGCAFTRAAIMGGNQGAVCVPSRAMIMTGKSLFHTMGKMAGHMLMPQWFRQRGYRSFMAGKWHNERPAVTRAFDDAKSVYFGGMGKAKKPGADGEGVEITVQDYDPTGKYPAAAARATDRDATEVIADSVVRFISDYRDSAPFFLYMATTSPHDPRVAPRRFRDLYDPAKIPLPPNFLPQHPFDNGEMRVRDELLAGFPRRPDEIRRHVADYYACISWLDYNVGRVFDALKKTGRWGNTIVVFAGDNGLALGQHGLMGKQSVYEHSIGVPLVFAGPGVAADRRTDAYAYLMDIFATVVDLVGIDAPRGLESVSLASIIRGEKQSVRDELFFAYRDLQRAVETRDLKLIEYYVNGQRRTQLFDLRDDPWEMKNLVEDASRVADMKTMREKLAAWQKRLDDPMLKERGNAN